MLILIILELILHIPLVGMVIAGFMSQLELTCSFGIALFNLITISSTWARVIDVMYSKSGSRLFGFIGACATLGQLFGSLFAAGMAWMGSTLLLVAALLMELAAQSSKGINRVPHLSEEHSPLNKPQSDEQTGGDQKTVADNQVWGKTSALGMHGCYCSKTWRCYCCRNVRLLFGSLKGKTSTLSLYALPVCFLWMVVAFYLGKRREQLTNFPALVLSPDSQSNDIPASASQPSDS